MSLFNPQTDVSMFMCRCCHSCSIDLTSDLWEVLPGGGSPAWLFLSGHWDPLRSANTSQSINITLRSSPKYPLWSFIRPRFLKEVYTNTRYERFEWCTLSVTPEQNKMCNERIYSRSCAVVLWLKNSNRLASLIVA